MKDNEIQITDVGPGANVSRDIPVSELSRYGDRWQVTGQINGTDVTGYSAEELSQMFGENTSEEEKSRKKEMAEAFRRRSRYGGSQVFEEMADEMVEEGLVEEELQESDWKQDESWSEYKYRKRKEIKNHKEGGNTRVEELSQGQGPSSEKKQAAAKAFRDRAKSSNGSDAWSDIAEELESGNLHSEELQQESNSFNDDGKTHVKNSNGKSYIDTVNQELKEELKQAEKESELVKIKQDSPTGMKAIISDLERFKSDFL